MKIGKEGIDLIKRWEGFNAKPYLCPAGLPTIGYGSTTVKGKKVSLNMPPCTEEQAEEWLMDEVNQIAGPCIEKNVKTVLNQSQFDAICAFVYNCGCGNFVKSTLLKKINSKDFLGASKEFAKWNKANGVVLKGLTNRRRDEANLFLKHFDPESSV